MWCKECRQDVPALLAGDQQSYCCPRCGEVLCAADEANCRSGQAEDSLCYDPWEMDEQLSELARILRSGSHGDDRTETGHQHQTKRFDGPHAVLPDRHSTPSTDRPSKRKSTANQRNIARSALTRLALAVGAMGCLGGGVLMGWSFYAGRHDLWTIGVPLALVGQIALLVGLIMQLDRMRRDHRRSADKLDERVADLKTAATLLSVNNGPASMTFYSHFAGGASPQLLLTDLKSQLDLLAMKISGDD